MTTDVKEAPLTAAQAVQALRQEGGEFRWVSENCQAEIRLASCDESKFIYVVLERGTNQGIRGSAIVFLYNDTSDRLNRWPQQWLRCQPDTPWSVGH